MRAAHGLPPFPVRTSHCAIPASLAARGLCLRHAHAGDFDWLAALYADTRSEELEGAPWPEATKTAFLHDQFALQHRHYMAHFADAEFGVLETGSGPVGRYYLQRRSDDDLIVDISLHPGWRGQGIGSALIAASQGAAAQAGRGMVLSVGAHNAAARRLYERLGFVHTGTEGLHQRMAWRAVGAERLAPAVS